MIREIQYIKYNEPRGAGYYKIGLSCNGEYKNAQPGQFVMLRFLSNSATLLRRPFSIHNLIEFDGRITGLEILIKVVGNFTRALAASRAGDPIDILGPLGKGFTCREDVDHVFMVSGGIGVAPMPFLAKRLNSLRKKTSQCVGFIGGRNETDILCQPEFGDRIKELTVSTEDGTRGVKGMITGPLENALEQTTPDMIYACGPMPMLRAVATLARKYGVPCEVSIETMMACGFGACMGCAVESKASPQKYLHACKDGPVFDAFLLFG
jgi:dihydroorotate dehydrogenase electron transfer subunit